MQASDENIRAWELQFRAPSATTGAEVQYFTIGLANASIASINMQMPNNKDPNLMKFDTFEEVAFSYQTIEWTWTDGRITASDDWVATR